MAEIAHTAVEQLTEQTHTGDTLWTDIPGASIASGNFTVGKKYLLIAHCLKQYNESGLAGFKVLHGSTDFASSDAQFPPDSGVAAYYPYFWWTVWTAVSGEAVKMQFKVDDNARTVKARRITLFAMNLSDDLTEGTDWDFAENSTVTDLSTTWSTTNNAAITFTPGSAGDDWLVMTRTRIDANVSFSSFNMEGRMDRGGEATSTEPKASEEREASTELKIFSLLRTFNLGASSNTFTEKSRESGATSFQRTHSGVFALNLAKFDVQANSWLETEVTLSTTDYATELRSISITPNVSGDVLVLGSWAHDVAAVSAKAKGRIQIDGTTKPAIDDVEQIQAYAAIDEILVQSSFVQNLTAAAHTIDMDGSSVTTARGAEDRQLVAFTMELPSTGIIPKVMHHRKQMGMS